MTIRYAVNDFDSIAKAMTALRRDVDQFLNDTETPQVQKPQTRQALSWSTPTLKSVPIHERIKEEEKLLPSRATARDTKEEKELKDFLGGWYNAGISDSAIEAGVRALQTGLSKQWHSKRIARAVFAAMSWSE